MSQKSASEEASKLFLHALTYGKKGDWDRAIRDWSVVIEMPEAPLDTKANAHYNRGFSYGKKGDRDRAIADYSAVIEMPEAPLDIKANVFCGRGMITERIEDIDRAIQINERYPYPWLCKGRFFSEIRNDYDGALPFFYRFDFLSSGDAQDDMFALLNSLYHDNITAPFFERRIFFKCVKKPKGDLYEGVWAFQDFFRKIEEESNGMQGLCEYISTLSLPDFEKKRRDGLIHYHMGDPNAAFEFFNKMDTEDENDLQAQYYFLLCLDARIEPGKQMEFAVEKATDISQDPELLDTKQLYYAALIFYKDRAVSDAVSCLERICFGDAPVDWHDKKIYAAASYALHFLYEQPVMKNNVTDEEKDKRDKLEGRLWSVGFGRLLKQQVSRIGLDPDTVFDALTKIDGFRQLRYTEIELPQNLEDKESEVKERFDENAFGKLWGVLQQACYGEAYLFSKPNGEINRDNWEETLVDYMLYQELHDHGIMRHMHSFYTPNIPFHRVFGHLSTVSPDELFQKEIDALKEKKISKIRDAILGEAGRVSPSEKTDVDKLLSKNISSDDMEAALAEFIWKESTDFLWGRVFFVFYLDKKITTDAFYRLIAVLAYQEYKGSDKKGKNFAASMFVILSGVSSMAILKTFNLTSDYVNLILSEVISLIFSSCFHLEDTLFCESVFKINASFYSDFKREIITLMEAEQEESPVKIPRIKKFINKLFAGKGA